MAAPKTAVEGLWNGVLEEELEDNSSVDQVKRFLKEFYLYSIHTLHHGNDTDIITPKPSGILLVDGFDAEQIWAQLETFDRVANQRHKQNAGCLNQDFSLLPDNIDGTLDFLLNEEQTTIQQDTCEEDTAVVDYENTQDGSLRSPTENSRRTHPIEDDFFTLKEMSAFLDDAENEGKEIDADAKDRLGEEEESETDEDDMDIFQDPTETADACDVDVDALNKPGNEIMYSDIYRSEARPDDHDRERKDRKEGKEMDGREQREIHRRQTKQSRMALEREMTQQKIEQLEEEAMEEKEWPFRGEISATNRPLNSALEVDLDHDTTVRPPPEPTQEHMDDIERLIKRRIAERQFDDVERVVPPPIEETKRVAELDDSKAKAGLAELYADEYIKNAHGQVTVEEKEEKLRMKARMLFKDACASLDALTHFHFSPRPIVEDVSIKPNVPSVRMEEVLPMGTTISALKPPQEIYHPASKTGETVNTKELTKEERVQMRAKRKRAFKASRRSDATNTGTAVIGRKSLSKNNKGIKKSKTSKKATTSDQQRHIPSFFERIQSHQQHKNKQKTSIVQNSIQMKL